MVINKSGNDTTEKSLIFEYINDKDISMDERIEKCIGYFPGDVRNDLLASKEYRTMLLKKSLSKMLVTLEGEGK